MSSSSKSILISVGILECSFLTRGCRSGQCFIYEVKTHAYIDIRSSFMKDLATLRNPGSPYTFLAYLHSQGRLLPFINRGSTIPTRKEYSDYLSWAAKRVEEEGINVLYGHEVVHIDEGIEDTIAIHYRSVSTGTEVVVRARE